jgi:tight adherence protein C
MGSELLALLTTATFALAFACCGRALAGVAPLPRPALGPRGLQRKRALASTPGFALVEPAMRWLSALLARLPVDPARTSLPGMLASSGDFLGLDAHELLALSLLAGMAAAVAGGLAGVWLELSPHWQAVGIALAGAAPFLRVRAEVSQRLRRIARALPPAIDLLALTMGAGLDFTGALELLVRELHDQRDPLVSELERVLHELALGRTRYQALASLAQRAPCLAVRDFVGAVSQAEQKGNPLAEVLGIQARTLRMRRSVAAEEAAARASVWLVLPMTLLLGAVLLVMLGPFIVNGLGV